MPLSRPGPPFPIGHPRGCVSLAVPEIDIAWKSSANSEIKVPATQISFSNTGLRRQPGLQLLARHPPQLGQGLGELIFINTLSLRPDDGAAELGDRRRVEQCAQGDLD